MIRIGPANRCASHPNVKRPAHDHPLSIRPLAMGRDARPGGAVGLWPRDRVIGVSEKREPRFPIIRRLFGVIIRMFVLAALVVVVGFGVGQAAGKLVTKIPDPIKGAKLLDHFTLAASLNPSTALVAAGDLPAKWQQGSPGFPLVGLEMCGKKTEAKGSKSNQLPVSTWVDASVGSVLLSEGHEFSSVQFASSYMTALNANLGKCSKFFVVGEGVKVEYRVTVPDGNPPVDEYVSRIIQPKDKSSYVVYSIFRAGKVVVALHYRGPIRPDRTLMTDTEKKILSRIDPEQFSTTTSSIKGSKDLPEKTVVTVDESKVSVINSASSGPSGAVATLPPAVTNPPPSSIAPVDENATTTTSRRRSSTATTEG